jgi:hypothetical protein
LLKRQSSCYFLYGFLKGSDLKTRERVDEFIAAQPGHFGRFGLRELAQFVPLDCRRQAKLPPLFSGLAAQRRKRTFGKV